MRFSDRVDAGRRLAERLRHLSAAEPIVLALPRGGIPVGAEVARMLHAPLDVLVVRKLGVPYQPELAMGAVGEDGVVVWNDDVRRMARVADAEALAVVQRETAEVARRATLLRGEGRAPIDVSGRTVVVVDDGVATGSTAVAGCRVLRARGAGRIVVAVPVAPPSTVSKLSAEADAVITVLTPAGFVSVGEWYDDFAQLTDEQALRLMRPTSRRAAGAASTAVGIEVEVEVGDATLPGLLTVPAGARGLVVFAHGSGSDRNSPRNRAVATTLQSRGFATLLWDLQTADERRSASTGELDVDLLGRRVVDAVAWARRRLGVDGLPVGLFGASTGAAVALWAAAEPASPVAAVVCRGGRPDPARTRLSRVTAPTLLIVGGRDGYVEDLNRRTLPLLHCDAELKVVPGAGHLFDQPGALATVAELAAGWFCERLSAAARPRLPDPQQQSAERTTSPELRRPRG